jgi:hypothetical protein
VTFATTPPGGDELVSVGVANSCNLKEPRTTFGSKPTVSPTKMEWVESRFLAFMERGAQRGFSKQYERYESSPLCRAL